MGCVVWQKSPGYYEDDSMGGRKRCHFLHLPVAIMSSSSKKTTQRMQRERRHVARTARRDALPKLVADDLMRPATEVMPLFSAALAAVLKPVVDEIVMVGGAPETAVLKGCDLAQYWRRRGDGRTGELLREGLLKTGFVGSMNDLNEIVWLQAEFVRGMVFWYERAMAEHPEVRAGHVQPSVWWGQG